MEISLILHLVLAVAAATLSVAYSMSDGSACNRRNDI